VRRSTLARALALAVAAIAVAGCDPRPFPAPAIESFVHTREVPPLGATVDQLDEATTTLVTDDGLHHVMAVKVMHRPAELRRGFAGIGRMPRGTGIVAIYADDRTEGVSPADLGEALDHTFIDADGQVVAVLRIAPCQAGAPCVAVDPEVTYRTILYTPSGWLLDQGIERGARVELGPIEPPSEQ